MMKSERGEEAVFMVEENRVVETCSIFIQGTPKKSNSMVNIDVEQT